MRAQRCVMLWFVTNLTHLKVSQFWQDADVVCEKVGLSEFACTGKITSLNLNDEDVRREIQVSTGPIFFLSLGL